MNNSGLFDGNDRVTFLTKHMRISISLDPAGQHSNGGADEVRSAEGSQRFHPGHDCHSQSIEVKDWTSDQCIQWLTAQEMTSFIPIFLSRNIDGEKLLLLDSTKMKVGWHGCAFTHSAISLLGDRHEIEQGSRSSENQTKRTETCGTRSDSRAPSCSTVRTVPSCSSQWQSITFVQHDETTRTKTLRWECRKITQKEGTSPLLDERPQYFYWQL